MPKPRIGITIGDPAGIGPEIIVKALSDPTLFDICDPLVIGETAALKRAAHVTDLESLTITPVDSPENVEFSPGTVHVLETGRHDISTLEWGKKQSLAGTIAREAIDKSIELGMAGTIDAVTTAPINKAVTGSGHTEIYRDGTHSPYVLTMFDCLGMRVFHLSLHTSLRNALDYVTKEHVLTALERIHANMEQVGLKDATIAVAGLNPHCGEGGLFGTEDDTEIRPAIEIAKSKGIPAIGPLPADTIFAKGKRGAYGSILALYHDQGHIPCKTLDLDASVSVTLGMPFLRCTPDHGTAFDIAGTGVADERSMRAALNVTATYAAAVRNKEGEE